jgi:hypothetical protein
MKCMSCSCHYNFYKLNIIVKNRYVTYGETSMAYTTYYVISNTITSDYHMLHFEPGKYKNMYIVKNQIVSYLSKKYMSDIHF